MKLICDLGPYSLFGSQPQEGKGQLQWPGDHLVLQQISTSGFNGHLYAVPPCPKAVPALACLSLEVFVHRVGEPSQWPAFPWTLCSATEGA